MTDPQPRVTPPHVTPLTRLDDAALRRFADAVLDARDGFRDNVKLYTERADELAADPIRAALCRGQAMAYREAAQRIDEALEIATGRWGQAKDEHVITDVNAILGMDRRGRGLSRGPRT